MSDELNGCHPKSLSSSATDASQGVESQQYLAQSLTDIQQEVRERRQIGRSRTVLKLIALVLK